MLKYVFPSQRVHCSLSLPKRTNEFSNQTCVFIRPTCLTLSLNKKFEATLTHDIHWISVFKNQRVNHRKHRHQPFQKLAQIFVGLQLKIFKPRDFYSIEILTVHATCLVKVLCVLSCSHCIELTCLPERTCKLCLRKGFIPFDVCFIFIVPLVTFINTKGTICLEELFMLLSNGSKLQSLRYVE